MVYNFAAINGLFVGFALLYGQPEEQLKQLLDCAALGCGFRMPLTFHVKHRPHTMRLKSYGICDKCFS